MTHGPIYEILEETCQHIETLTKDKENSNIALTMKPAYNFYLRMMEKLLPKIQELEPVWISVEDKLPPRGETVILMEQDGNIHSGARHGSGSSPYSDMYDYEIFPTHWQKLSLLPK